MDMDATTEKCERCGTPIQYQTFPGPDMAHNDGWFEPLYDPDTGKQDGGWRHTPERCAAARDADGWPVA